MDTPPEIPPEQSLITYPTHFPIKVMGENVEGFAEAIVAFRVGASAPRAATGGRKVTARFTAKAPGVSPLRVALVNAHRADADGAPPDGKGIVRVR